MKTIVILGNGFDIDLGLNTKFETFIASTHFIKYSLTPLMNDIRKNYKNDKKRWCDIEQLFRDLFIDYQKNPSQDLFENINNSWLMINKAWGIYLPEITELDKIKIKKDSCAYKFLEYPKSKSLCYTFNYTSPYYLAGFKDKEEPTPIHGWFEPREQTNKGFMYRIPDELIIGIDSNAINPNCKSIELNHIVKKNHPRYGENNFINDLFCSDNIIIYGHSMGITDSDYFYDFFTALKNGILSHKNIFFVTYNQTSMLDIEKNLEQMGFSINELRQTENKFSSIYTADGQSNPRYNELLTLL